MYLTFIFEFVKTRITQFLGKDKGPGSLIIRMKFPFFFSRRQHCLACLQNTIHGGKESSCPAVFVSKLFYIMEVLKFNFL
jgi:hypothetical protein